MQNIYNAPLSEEETKLRYITPALENAGWDKKRIRMELYFTDGRVQVHGGKAKRATGKKADYLLFWSSNQPLAIVEAKKYDTMTGDGMDQALDYAQTLDVPFAYTSNGKNFLEHDLLTGKERTLSMKEFPSPEDLWQRFRQARAYTPEEEELIQQPYYFADNVNTPRYYQRIAINRTVEAVARGQQRILLVMATGTGKTYTAFQIIHRLWKSGRKKRILFLADRNVLVDQTMSQDFAPFGDKMHKVEHKKLDSSYEIYLSLYQQLAGDENEEPFRAFAPTFFDLIIVDECHRGSARENSRWRKILDYFHTATHIGMTATPKETEDISNSDYFGEPIYTYSLKQGIDDGFLAPYTVVRVELDKDLEGWRPEAGKLDVYGNEVEDREYTVTDFDRNLIIDERTTTVAHHISQYLKKRDPFAKTIVFCASIDHAERMRQALVNENSEFVKQDPRYVMRITGDNAVGKKQLDNFTSVKSKYPVIVTTSRLMTTGVDCKTCRLIVLDNVINSISEFKQIIGRGTRLRPDCDKWYFTIMDFRNVCRLFSDPDFDGDPIPVDDDGGQPGGKTTPDTGSTDGKGKGDEQKKVIPRVNGVEVRVLNERVQYYDKDGKLITGSITDYSRRNILQRYATLDAFLHAWDAEERKATIVEELENQGVLLSELREAAGDPAIDDFDLICHVAFDKPPLTRAERVRNVRKGGYLHKYSDQARAVIEALLDKYKDSGITQLEDLRVLQVEPFSAMDSPMNLAQRFGGRDQFLQALHELRSQLYTVA